MKKITENLYQGSVDDITNSNLPENITAIVSVGHSCIVDVDEHGKKIIPTYHIPLVEFIGNPNKHPRTLVRVSSDNEIIAVVELMVKLIEKGHVVFCHCDAGICRSVGICAAYLIRADMYGTLKTAHERVSGHKESFRLANVFNQALDKIYGRLSNKYWVGMDQYVDMLNGVV